ncbi:hypothetical protein [Candidatus Thiothrix anitrata]|uniref:hypothetical protein n=1 Tax=Candidatus Thiothrix anitrata TaxID=2823902 RepID=UPI001D189C8D|nr:hypothetical protein [Candidatus Thiothrix anitrata]
MNQNAAFRKRLDKVLGVHPQAKIPSYHSDKGRDRVARYENLDESKRLQQGALPAKWRFLPPATAIATNRISLMICARCLQSMAFR